MWYYVLCSVFNLSFTAYYVALAQPTSGARILTFLLSLASWSITILFAFLDALPLQIRNFRGKKFVLGVVCLYLLANVTAIKLNTAQWFSKFKPDEFKVGGYVSISVFDWYTKSLFVITGVYVHQCYTTFKHPEFSVLIKSTPFLSELHLRDELAASSVGEKAVSDIEVELDIQ